MIGIATALSLALLTSADPTGLPVNGISDVSEAEVLAELRKGMFEEGNGGVMTALATAFPVDFAAFEQELLGEVMAGTINSTTAETMGREFSQMLVSRHIDRVAEAQTADLVNLSSLRIDMMKALQQGHAAACHELVETGLSAERSVELGEEPNRLQASWSRLVIDIVSQPPQGVSHPEPSNQDWEKIGDRYAELGGDPQWLDALFGTQDFSGQTHTERCANAVIWETAVSEAPAEIRAYYIGALHGASAPTAAP